MKKKLEEHRDSELFYMLKGDKQTAEKAFAELYARLSPRVYAYCKRFLGNREEAQDVFQEAFVKFFESAKVEREMQNAPAFIIRIARNLCLNRRRKETVDLVSFEEYMIEDYEQLSDKEELLEILKAAIELLPDEYRDAFILREYDGMSYQEISEITGEKVANVRTRIHRAKQKVRDILQPYLREMQKFN